MMEEKNPLISVVIPAYNEEKYVGNTLKTVLSQNYPKEDFEVIVVDNNSTDKTSEVAKSFKVKVVECKTKGVAAARQAGVAAARGQIIAFTDADAYLPESWLIKISERMSDPSVIAFGGQMLPKDVGRVTLFFFAIYDIVIRIHAFFGKYILWGNNMAVRRDKIMAIGGFNLKLSTSEDWDLCRRLAKKFGKEGKIEYNSSQKVWVSNRKQKNLAVMIRYFIDGFYSYVNVVLLGRARSAEIITVR